MAGEPRTFDGPSARDIGMMLNQQAEALAFALFPAARRAGGFVCIGSVEGEAGDSLKITIAGGKAGSWADYSCSPGEERGKGDMLKLVKLTVGEGEWQRTLRWAKGWLGIDSMDPATLEKQQRKAAVAQARAEARRAGDVERKRRGAEGLWQFAQPLQGTPAMRYLQGRGIDFAAIGRIPRALRFRPDVWHKESGRKLPALVTAFIGIDGTHQATHATYLERRGDGAWTKIPDIELPDAHGELKAVKCAKKIFGPGYWGAHIPINKGSCRASLGKIEAGIAIECSEGIEDALTFAMAQPEARVVAAGTLGNIGQMVLPPQAGDFTILAQRDAIGSHADAALEAAIARQQAQARAQAGAGEAPRSVRCRWPAVGFKDFNDQLLGKGMAA